MPRNYFTEEQMRVLSESKWVEKVTKANVSFTKEFKLDIADKIKHKVQGMYCQNMK